MNSRSRATADLSIPKSIEGVPTRWFSRPLTTCRHNGRTYKAGGKVAILNCPVPGWLYVQVYQPDNEDWWDSVPPDMPIRAAIRNAARNGEDLIAYALPLRNQPSALQKHIKSLTVQQLPLPEPKTAPAAEPNHPWADAFYEGLRRRQEKRQVERRPRGATDEGLMQMVERIATATDERVCDTVNRLLWEAVNIRLGGNQ